MRPYLELNSHHIGKSHLQSGLSCEDYSATYSDDLSSIIVVSDGHGDKNCFRSNRGAKYACEIALITCKQFAAYTKSVEDITQCDFERMIVTLESKIVDRWQQKVVSDASTYPFSEDELALASREAQEIYRNGQRIEKAYGCTLILAMCTAHYWLALQVGDGKCVAAYKDGVYVEPIPVDENCLGNRSTSLCNTNAKEAFRHYYSGIRPVAVFVSSDGVEESFDQAGLNNLFYSVAYWLIEDGREKTQARIDELLPQISEGGSGDDVSISYMVSVDDIIMKPRQTLDQVYERVHGCQNALEQSKEALIQANKRIGEKAKECNTLKAEIERLKEELEKKEKQYERCMSEKDKLDNIFQELEEKTQQAEEKMTKAMKYKEAAERYWFNELEKIGLKPLQEREQDEDKKNDGRKLKPESPGTQLKKEQCNTQQDGSDSLKSDHCTECIEEKTKEHHEGNNDARLEIVNSNSETKDCSETKQQTSMTNGEISQSQESACFQNTDKQGIEEVAL